MVDRVPGTPASACSPAGVSQRDHASSGLTEAKGAKLVFFLVEV